MITMQYASQIEMFELDHKGIPGATWWQGHWEFVVPWFGPDDLTCTVYKVSKSGDLMHEDVPIDNESRITILNKKYGPALWNH